MKNESETSGKNPVRWMVVDDDEGIREFIGSLLEMTGEVEVCRFSSGPEALSAFASAPENFQLILTDFEMPGMNGVEFCRRVLVLAPRAKVLLVTGDVNITEAGARRWGFCGLVRKPFPAMELQQAVEAAQSKINF